MVCSMEFRDYWKKKYVDLDQKLSSSLEVELLKRTPSSYLGSCRYKLPEYNAGPDVYHKLFEIFNKLEIKYFFYIGGNDSMDTVKKLSDYASVIQSDIRFIGVPKTIDNDLDITDHTPGYGSAAKYIATTMKEVIRDSLVYDQKSVTIVEIMGRNVGWLTGAAALAKGSDCVGADLLYLPETNFDFNSFVEKINRLQETKNPLVVAISEGIHLADGKHVCELSSSSNYVDGFGHSMLSGAAKYLADFLKQETGCKTRGIELNTLQRCASHIASWVDIKEAYQVGETAVYAAKEGKTGEMVILKRILNKPYQCITDTYDIHKVANIEKKVPLDWINEGEAGVSEEFIEYVRPLVADELTPVMMEGLPMHIPYVN